MYILWTMVAQWLYSIYYSIDNCTTLASIMGMIYLFFIILLKKVLCRKVSFQIFFFLSQRKSNAFWMLICVIRVHITIITWWVSQELFRPFKGCMPICWWTTDTDEITLILLCLCYNTFLCYTCKRFTHKIFVYNFP